MSTAPLAGEKTPLTTSPLQPLPVVQGTSFAGSRLTPRQQLHFYTPGQWEEFIREWAAMLDGYLQVKRLGGPNDAGADVAAFKTPNGFFGAWDCYQGKHYGQPLMPSDAYPEMLKVFGHVLDGDYVMPDAYSFMAPQGVGPTLNQKLSRPTELKEAFLGWLQGDSPLPRSLDAARRELIKGLAENTDFARFRSAELEDVLEQHRASPNHAARFGVPLPPRPATPQPPSELAAIETRYVEQLLEVYAEAHPSEVLDPPTLAQHHIVGSHFQRQRTAFYSAEALRVHARDSVPEGTFEALVDDMHAGVVELAESSHDSGIKRLAKVLSLAATVDLSSHTLVAATNVEDRKGICHRLANEDRLQWIPK